MERGAFFSPHASRSTSVGYRKSRAGSTWRNERRAANPEIMAMTMVMATAAVRSLVGSSTLAPRELAS